MDANALRAMQAPIKERYKSDPKAASITLKATGTLDDVNIACKVQTGRALAVAGRIQSGICHINGQTLHDQAQMPFGGVKASGYGRFGGKAAIDEFTELRWVTIASGKHQYPI